MLQIGDEFDQPSVHHLVAAALGRPTFGMEVVIRISACTRSGATGAISRAT